MTKELRDVQVLARTTLRRLRHSCSGAADSLINTFESLATAASESRHSGLSAAARAQMLRRANRWAHAARKAFFARCLVR